MARKYVYLALFIVGTVAPYLLFLREGRIQPTTRL
jgi:Mn2+/Fe2+ NRAMP family transporter